MTSQDASRELLPQTAVLILAQWALVGMAWGFQFLPRMLPDSLPWQWRFGIAGFLVLASGMTALIGGLALVVRRILETVRLRTVEGAVAVLVSAVALVISLVVAVLPVVYGAAGAASLFSGVW